MDSLITDSVKLLCVPSLEGMVAAPMSGGIYLDFQATTPIDPEVLEAMLPWMRRASNAHATEHAWGLQAEAAIDQARQQIAMAVNGEPDGVIFTGSATEAANIVLRSLAGPGGRVLISTIEHPSVAETAAACASAGAQLAYVRVDDEGLVDLDDLAAQVRESDLVSIMAVNNEIGTIQPVDTIAALCRSVGALFHTDAVQALGKIPIDMASGITFATLSAHKAYGPQGIGAICADQAYVKRLKPLMTGGGQQGGIRPGTLPVALCVGFGAACELAARRLEEDAVHCAFLHRTFLERLSQVAGDYSINGTIDARVPQNLNISFGDISADELLALLPGLALSTGSACSSGAIEPSRVLTAMGLPEEEIRSSIRIGFGRTTHVEEVALAADRIGAAVRRLRGE
jgi:cysteine desulfurase